MSEYVNVYHQVPKGRGKATHRYAWRREDGIVEIAAISARSEFDAHAHIWSIGWQKFRGRKVSITPSLPDAISGPRFVLIDKIMAGTL